LICAASFASFSSLEPAPKVLADKTKIRGYIQQLADDRFVVIDDRTGTAATVPYPRVKQVEGNNLSAGAVVAIAVVVIGLLFAIGFTHGP
jgi:hypothetical protein